jgi:hypothetical protein
MRAAEMSVDTTAGVSGSSRAVAACVFGATSIRMSS